MLKKGSAIKRFFLVVLFAVGTIFAQDLDEFDGEFGDVNKSEVFDPLSGYNRVMSSFNDTFYIHILTPSAKGYAYVVPEGIRDGINNFFSNLFFPIRFVNNLLQLKFDRASSEAGRFFINSTFGFFGFFDPASKELKMQKYSEDFGQTLGFYGIGDGFSIVLPFLGPSNLRDLVGLGVDLSLSPVSYMAHNTLTYKIPNDAWQGVAFSVEYLLNDYSFEPNRYEIFKKDALDLYPYLRDAYKQKRDKEIRE